MVAKDRELSAGARTIRGFWGNSLGTGHSLWSANVREKRRQCLSILPGFYRTLVGVGGLGGYGVGVLTGGGLRYTVFTDFELLSYFIGVLR
jgi:hypothetical protein